MRCRLVACRINQPLFCKCQDDGAGQQASMFRKDGSVSQSSLISLRTAETSLSSEALLGNSVATRVCRLISLLSRSSPFMGAGQAAGTERHETTEPAAMNGPAHADLSAWRADPRKNKPAGAMDGPAHADLSARRADPRKNKPAGAMDGPAGVKWRGQDSNLRPRGYEPRELPGCSTPRRVCCLGRTPLLTCPPDPVRGIIPRQTAK